MSKTIYYLGAGASYGKRDESKNILEGLPVVSEIPQEFDAFYDFIKTVKIPEKDYIVYWRLYKKTPADVTRERDQFLQDINDLKAAIKEHATIDTYARKLYLTGKSRQFSKLKDVLCAFFFWEQFQHKSDNRYDTFLANVLLAETLSLPKEISIISWNYDSQIESAYWAYTQEKVLPLFEKNTSGKWHQLTEEGRIIKVNGSAVFSDGMIIPYITGDAETPIELQLIESYSNTHVDTSEMGFQFKTHLSFAWEHSENSQKMKDTIKATVEDTEQIVVVGYSFPFFNRETDREIFRNMKSLKKVYIQDPNPKAVRLSLEAVLPDNSSVEIVELSDCTQFYLPKEL